MTDKKNTKPEDKNTDDKAPTQPDEFYLGRSFVRDEGELRFYNTPLLKKNHLKVIFGVGIFLILLCTFTVFRLLYSIDTTKPIVISGNAKGLGVYDPSIAYNPNNKKMWMAYSSIHERNDKQVPDINTNIAVSYNHGQTWKFIETVFSGKKDLLSGTNGQILDVEGVWRYETPTLVYDPEDKEQTWKLYAYKYFWTGESQSARNYSVITYKYTSNIESGKWSGEEWLFSARKGQPPAPYNNMILLHLNKLDQSLQNIIYYTEPAIINYQNKLLMTLTAYKEDGQPDSIIMIGSADHGQSWVFLGELLTSKQARHYGDYSRVDSSSLFENKGKLHLMVSFGNKNIEHQGTHIFTFNDFTQGTLKSDANNYPIITEYIDSPIPKALTVIGSGQSTYHEALAKGVIIPQVISNDEETPFRIYQTKTKLFEE